MADALEFMNELEHGATGHEEEEESQQETRRHPFPFIFDPVKKLLALGGDPVRVVEDSLGNAWFQAKPMVVFLEYGSIHVNQTLGRLDPEDVKSLEALLPSQITQNVSYHEKKEFYINEPGFYDLILGSQKPDARLFKRWITHDVLPALRRSSSIASAPAPTIDPAALQMAIMSVLETTHGMMEITGNRIGIASKKQQKSLLRVGTVVDDSKLHLIEAEGGSLHVINFLVENGVDGNLISRFAPTFSKELHRRKRKAWDAVSQGGPLWIAWSQGAWRIYYTEADRDLMVEVFEDPLTKQNLEKLRETQQRRRAPTTSSGGATYRRSGPYERPLA